MATLDLNQLASSILSAMQGVLGASWKSVASLAAGEAQKLAGTFISIQTGIANGSISQDQASILLDMQQHASRAVLMSIEGIGMLIAEQAIQAGLNAVASAVNGAVGFTLV